jgi:hypothetical protein
MAVETLLDGEAKATARKAVEKALEVDMADLVELFCLESRACASGSSFR